VGRETGTEPEAVATSYYALGEFIDFAWLWARLAEAGEEDRWQRRAAEGLIEDLLTARRRLTRLALADAAALPSRALALVQSMIRDLRGAPRVTLAGLAVVAREFRRLADDAASSRGQG
jgi:NAD-specific glutamate dehydrogenase